MAQTLAPAKAIAMRIGQLRLLGWLDRPLAPVPPPVPPRSLAEAMYPHLAQSPKEK